MGLLEVVNGHVPVVVAHDHQVGVVRVHVETHDAALAAEAELREAGVLHAVEQQQAPALLQEVICRREGARLWGRVRLPRPAPTGDKPCHCLSERVGFLSGLHLLCLRNGIMSLGFSLLRVPGRVR